MTKPHKPREEPKLDITELEGKSGKVRQRQWPKDDFHVEKEEEGKKDENIETEEIGILEHPSYKKLAEELMKAEAKVNELWNQQLSARAELENVRRRAEREVSSAHKYGLEKFVDDLLPVVDSLERALQSDVNDNEFAKKIHEGIELTMSMFLKTLEKFGVKQVDPQDQLFNHELHQAIKTEVSDVRVNTVLKVLQKGYVLNERLIRPALVIVATSA
jgi:molecular chaperone GrpE